MDCKQLYLNFYKSPLGKIALASDGTSLLGLWFEGQKYYMEGFEKVKFEEKNLPVFKDTKRWLDIYFEGKKPSFMPELSLMGSKFQLCVWEILKEIPFGKTLTYKEVSKLAAKRLHKEKMSAQATGGAIGRNPISILIPCHRVIAQNGNLTGYAGGIDKKLFLLKLEGALS